MRPVPYSHFAICCEAARLPVYRALGLDLSLAILPMLMPGIFVAQLGHVDLRCGRACWGKRGEKREWGGKASESALSAIPIDLVRR